MRLRLLFFAGLRDTLGMPCLSYEPAVESKQVAHLRRELALRFPVIAESTIRVAVNEEFVSEAHVLRDGDEVAFIPPVSGG
jgi:molybdopterin synthase sulfur carrier subunit